MKIAKLIAKALGIFLGVILGATIVGYGLVKFLEFLAWAVGIDAAIKLVMGGLLVIAIILFVVFYVADKLDDDDD